MITTSSDTNGILDIELLPRPEWADVTNRLAYTINQARAMRAAVAYWTIGPDEVSHLLAPLLSRPDSFLCVDIHFPTDLDQLDHLNERGAQLWLHLRHLSTHTETVNRGLPQHLMHAKLLLFDLPDGTAEIWIGSHNWTLRALCGPNIEESMVIHVRPESRIYNDTVETLSHIRNLCTRFRHDNLQDYHKLQDPDKETGAEFVPVIELEGNDMGALHGAIALFSTRDSDSDWENLRKIQELVYLEVTDLKTGHSSIYSANILHSGLQPAANPEAGGLVFSRRRYAVIDGKQRPVLQPIAKPSNALLESSAYFVTLELHEMLDTAMMLKPSSSRQVRWVRAHQDPLLKRILSEPSDDRLPMEQAHPNMLRARLKKRPLEMKIPAFFATQDEVSQQTSFLSEAERKQLKQQRFPLISYKLLVDTRPMSME